MKTPTSRPLLPTALADLPDHDVFVTIGQLNRLTAPGAAWEGNPDAAAALEAYRWEAKARRQAREQGGLMILLP